MSELVHRVVQGAITLPTKQLIHTNNNIIILTLRCTAACLAPGEEILSHGIRNRGASDEICDK